jgi:hypothetical protein
MVLYAHFISFGMMIGAPLVDDGGWQMAMAPLRNNALISLLLFVGGFINFMFNLRGNQPGTVCICIMN